MTETVLITGGARSGKSTFALERAAHFARKGFIATAVAFDDEMHERIRRHQEERDTSFVTVEEPYDVAGIIAKLSQSVDCIILDCITVWLSTVMYRHRDSDGPFPPVEDLLHLLKNAPCPLFIVTNEVGMGIVPENETARRFRDIQGTVNRRIAAYADTVVFMVSGLPVLVKGSMNGPL